MNEKVKVIITPNPRGSSRNLLWVYAFVQMALRDANRLEESAYLKKIFANTEDKNYTQLMEILKGYAVIEYEEKLN